MQRFVDRKDCQLAFDRRGAGPTVLWIQGVGVAGSGWQPQIEVLAGEFACVSLDNRGIGASPWSGRGLTIERLAGDAIAVVDAAGGGDFHLVGHSLGGLIALQVALDVRPRVRSLALLCTFPGGRWAAPLTPRMMWLGMRARVGTRSMRRKGFMQLVLPPGTPGDPEMASKLAALFGHDLADQPPVVSQQLRALRACDLSRRLGELAGIPTLVVSATHDPIAPPSAGRALAAGIQGARFVEAPDASHGLPITHAEQINQLLAEHLRGADAHQSLSR